MIKRDEDFEAETEAEAEAEVEGEKLKGDEFVGSSIYK